MPTSASRRNLLLPLLIAAAGIGLAAYTLWPNTAPRQWPSDAQRARGGGDAPRPRPGGGSGNREFTQAVPFGGPADANTLRGNAAAPGAAPTDPAVQIPGTYTDTSSPEKLAAAMAALEARLVEIGQKPAGSFGDAEKIAALSREFFAAAIGGDTTKAGALLAPPSPPNSAAPGNAPAGDKAGTRRPENNPMVALLRSAGLDTDHMTVRAIDPKDAARPPGLGPPPGPGGPPGLGGGGGPNGGRRMVMMTAPAPGSPDAPAFAKVLDITAPVLPEGAAAATGSGEVTIRVALDPKTSQWRIISMQAAGFDQESMKRAMRRDK